MSVIVRYISKPDEWTHLLQNAHNRLAEIVGRFRKLLQIDFSSLPQENKQV